MSLQAKLNTESLKYVPTISKILDSDLISTKLKSIVERTTLREMLDSNIAVIDMTSQEIEKFESEILSKCRDRFISLGAGINTD